MEDVYAQIGNGQRWKVGNIRDEKKPDNEWIKKNTGILVDNVKSINWNDVILAWVIKL